MMTEKLLMPGSNRPTLRTSAATNAPASLGDGVRELTNEELDFAAGGMATKSTSGGGGANPGHPTLQELYWRAWFGGGFGPSL